MATTVTPKALVQGVLLQDTVQTLYTAGVGITAVLRSITLCNVTGSVRTVTIHLVAVGDTPSDANMIFNAIPLDGTQTKTLIDDSLRVLEPGDFIAALADVADAIAMRADGSEVT